MSNENISRDMDLDIMELMRGTSEEEHKSPLDELMESKKTGIEITKEEYYKDDSKKRSYVDNDKRNEDFKKEMDSIDKNIEKLKYIGKIEKPKNEVEMAKLMTALDSVSLEELQKRAEENKTEPITVDVVTGFADNKEESVNENDNKLNTDIERQDRIDVIIDKTGLGMDVFFTEEEKAKMSLADEIRVVEVEEIELATARVKKSTKSFLETVSSYKNIGVRTPMTFPCSRFRAEIGGLTYGEYGDLALSTLKNSYDNANKILSLIYNKMHNASIGEFESYEDFLKKMAWVDVPLAKFALYISTNPETDEIGLHCNSPECNKDFPHKFNTRSLIRFEEMSDTSLKWLEKVASATHPEAQKMFEEAPHRCAKAIKLKNSGWVINLGYVDCYRYLNNVINNTIDEVFKKEHPDDVNGVLQFYGIFMENILSVAIPDGEGGYIEFEDFADIIEALYHLDSEDFDIVKSLVFEFANVYGYEFGVKNVKCPHCGKETAYVSVDLDSLVFQSYQRRMTTNVKVKNVTPI